MFIVYTVSSFSSKTVGFFPLLKGFFFKTFSHILVTVGEMGSFSCEMVQTLPGAAPKGANMHFPQAV